jgi:2',3'-cyclic-nucleotide 2'-phosphodiesterase (5'-nucleotidase family)
MSPTGELSLYSLPWRQPPFLSANLVWAENGTRPFAPYIIIEERDGVSIGVLGLTASLNYDRHRDALDIRELIKHMDPVEVAQEFVPRLRQQVDVLIVLSHLGHLADRMLAQSVKGIDIILAGHMHLVMTEPVIVGETLIVEKGWKGGYMGRLDLIISFSKEGQ